MTNVFRMLITRIIELVQTELKKHEVFRKDHSCMEFKPVSMSMKQ